jgi:hypothetical protein
MNRPVKLRQKDPSPALRCLNLIARRLAAIRRDTPALARMGGQMARRLLAGGQIFAPGLMRFWEHEFYGRAGGLMGLQAPSWQPASKNDVAFLVLPPRGKWDESVQQRLKGLLGGKAALFAVGRRDDLPAGVPSNRFEGFTGGVKSQEGLYGLGEHRPLAPLRLLEIIVRGWIAAGEMICACIRGGKMPVIWMSAWLEGSFIRNISFIEQDNLREPWSAPLFHKGRYIPPLPPGCAAEHFLGMLGRIRESLAGQGDRLAQAGKWLAEAHQAGRRPWTVLVGHSYPLILQLPGEDKQRPVYPLRWGPSVSDLARALPGDLKRGDVVMHLGYGPVNVPAAREILGRGIRLIHTTPYGRPPGMKPQRNFLWLDLPWRPSDASVDVPGYGVRILPSSSSAQTMALLAILSEMADRMGWS